MRSSIPELVATAERAYERAVVEVFDTLRPGARVDLDTLTPAQRDAFEDLVVAEAELANGRDRRYRRGQGRAAIRPRPARTG